ncbi:hypothetical protein V2G26_017704 [Clonostachys chloroleuca]
MFSNLPIGQLAPKKKIDPKDIPPPTPVVLPRYQPIAQDDASVDVADALPTLLRSIGRSMPSFLGPKGLSALGVNLELDVPHEELVPDPSFIPNFKSWEQLSPDEAQDLNQSTRIPIRNGNLSPGCQTYLERKKELSNTNEDGFRTVRRLPLPRVSSMPVLVMLMSSFAAWRTLQHTGTILPNQRTCRPLPRSHLLKQRRRMMMPRKRPMEGPKKSR